VKFAGLSPETRPRVSLLPLALNVCGSREHRAAAFASQIIAAGVPFDIADSPHLTLPRSSRLAYACAARVAYERTDTIRVHRQRFSIRPDRIRSQREGRTHPCTVAVVSALRKFTRSCLVSSLREKRQSRRRRRRRRRRREANQVPIVTFYTARQECRRVYRVRSKRSPP